MANHVLDAKANQLGLNYKPPLQVLLKTKWWVVDVLSLYRRLLLRFRFHETNPFRAYPSVQLACSDQTLSFVPSYLPLISHLIFLLIIFVSCLFFPMANLFLVYQSARKLRGHYNFERLSSQSDQ